MDTDLENEKLRDKVKGFKILIVEDEELVASILRKWIEARWPVEVTITGKGKEAIEIAKNIKPILMVVDISLADNITGLEVIKQIRRENLKTKVIIISANANSAEYSNFGNEYSVSAILNKAVSRDLYIKAIKDILEKGVFGSEDSQELIFDKAIETVANGMPQLIDQLNQINIIAVQFKNQNNNGVFENKGLIEKQIIDEAINMSDKLMKEADRAIVIANTLKLIKNKKL